MTLSFTLCVAAMCSICPSPVQVAFTLKPHSSSSGFVDQASPPMLYSPIRAMSYGVSSSVNSRVSMM